MTHYFKKARFEYDGSLELVFKPDSNMTHSLYIDYVFTDYDGEKRITINKVELEPFGFKSSGITRRQFNILLNKKYSNEQLLAFNAEKEKSTLIEYMGHPIKIYETTELLVIEFFA